jgi:hypothetical protein
VLLDGLEVVGEPVVVSPPVTSPKPPKPPTPNDDPCAHDALATSEAPNIKIPRDRMTAPRLG